MTKEELQSICIKLELRTLLAQTKYTRDNVLDTLIDKRKAYKQGWVDCLNLYIKNFERILEVIENGTTESKNE